MADQASANRFDAMLTTDEAEAEKCADELRAKGQDAIVVPDADGVHFRVSVTVKS